MSADPVTMFVVSAAKAVYDIKESKKQAEIEQQLLLIKQLKLVLVFQWIVDHF
jgi:hypothetical protein